MNKNIFVGNDVGNYMMKLSNYTSIKSVITEEEPAIELLDNDTKTIELDGKKYYIGVGSFETELNKAKKETFLPLLLTGIDMATPKYLSSFEAIYNVVCGLPINQFKTNKEYLEKLVLDEKIRYVTIDGERKRICIDSFAVYPECIGAYYSLEKEKEEDIILVDIGGRTTDIAYISRGKLISSSTVPVGTLNIYSNIVKKLNGLYNLTVDLNKVDRILETGKFNVDGKQADISFITGILKSNFLKIKEELDLNYPARTEQIILAGGGSKLFGKAFNSRYNNCTYHNDPIFANALGFKKVGEILWQKTQ